MWYFPRMECRLFAEKAPQYCLQWRYIHEFGDQFADVWSRYPCLLSRPVRQKKNFSETIFCSTSITLVACECALAMSTCLDWSEWSHLAKGNVTADTSAMMNREYISNYITVCFNSSAVFEFLSILFFLSLWVTGAIAPSAVPLELPVMFRQGQSYFIVIRLCRGQCLWCFYRDNHLWEFTWFLWWR